MNRRRKTPANPFLFDHKPAFFVSWLLYRLFKRVHFDQNMSEDLKQMHREGTVVYAIKYRGHLDFLLYHYRFRMSRLPYPKIAFDLNLSLVLPLSQLIRILKIQLSHFFRHGKFLSPYESGFFREAIEKGTTSLLCLVDPKGFARRFIHAEKDRIYFLLETQKSMERPIYFVPQLVLYKKTPEKEHAGLRDILLGFKDNPGFIRKIALFFRHNRRAFIDFGRPLNLKAYLEGQPEGRSMSDMAGEIRQMLIDSIDTQKRVILGPIMKSRQQLKEKVLTDPAILEDIENGASGNKARLKRMRKKAGEYFDEIAADYNIAYILLFQKALNWFWHKIFEGLEVDSSDLARLRESARRGPLIYVPSHKSHIDYLVINYILFENHMHIPRVAAGRNLAFWPMGHIFRKSGAFFIRRTFKGAKLYAKVFTRYIKALLEEGHPLEFFIEGGRSRSGKLILPKIGFLSILLQAYQEGYCDDLIFVPASISYDKILEEKSYLKETWGAEKEKESFKQVLKARHFLKRKYGKIYIRFGQPIALKEYLDQEAHGNGVSHRKLAFRLIQSINRVTLVTPLSLVATAILTKHRRGFILSELIDTGKMLLEFLQKRGVFTATTLADPVEVIQETVSLLVSGKVVDVLEDIEGEEVFYYVEEDKKRELEYYKNSIIHFFIPHAFVAVSLLNGTEAVKTDQSLLEDYKFLKKVFKKEFVYDNGKDLREEIDAATASFLDASYITRINGGGYNLSKLGFDRLPIWAALVKTFLESYWIASRSILQQEKKGGKRGDLLKNMRYLGLRFHKLGLIDHVEAVSQLNFRNAIRFINEEVMKAETHEEDEHSSGLKALSRLSQRLYDLSRYAS